MPVLVFFSKTTVDAVAHGPDMVLPAAFVVWISSSASRSFFGSIFSIFWVFGFREDDFDLRVEVDGERRWRGGMDVTGG